MAEAGTVTVDFAAETAKFTAELKKVQSSLARIEGDFKRLDKVANVALRFFSGQALLGFAKQAFTAADAVGGAAERAGIAVESFSRLKFAAEQSDVEMQSLTVGLRKFQVELSQAAEGGNSAAGAFAQIGLSGKQLSSLGLEQQLAAVADAFKRIESPADRVRVATELFGRSGSELVPLLRQGADGINRLTAEADRLGITLSGATAAGIEEADKAIKRLTATLQGYTAKFVGGLALAILGPSDEGLKLDDQIIALSRRRDQLVAGGVAGATAGSPERIELERINAELATAISRWNVLNGMITPRRSGGPLQRNPLVNIRSPLEEIDLEAIKALRIPDDPLGLNVDADVMRAQGNEAIRDAQLQVADAAAARQKEVEAEITKDLERQLDLRAQAVTNFSNLAVNAENAMLAARENAMSAGLQALQAFAGGSKKVAIALVLINKARAISQAIQNTIVGSTLQLTSGDPYTAIARAAAVKAWGAVQVAAIAATGFGEIQAINQSGGAPRGSAVNPVITHDADGDGNGATAQRSVSVTIQGNLFSSRETAQWLIEQIQEAVEDRDVVLISSSSRNARELVPS